MKKFLKPWLFLLLICFSISLGTPAKALTTNFSPQDTAKTYKITYVLNGGKQNPANPDTYVGGCDKIVLAAPTRTGYDFAGWYSDSAMTKKISGILAGSTGNKTRYAKWTPHTYRVKFNGNGATSGSMTTLTNLTYGKTFTLPANAFKRSGCRFKGWNTKADGSGIQYANKAQVKNLAASANGLRNLYAQWEKKYTITYVLNGGTQNSDNPTYYYKTSATKTLLAPTKANYTFDGWYTDPNFTYESKVTAIWKGSTGNKKLYAKWHVNRYSIIFTKNASDATGVTTYMSGCIYTKTYTLRKNGFSRQNYKFTGWNTKADGSGKSYADEASVSKLVAKDGDSIYLYAQWEALTNLSVTINGSSNYRAMTLERGEKIDLKIAALFNGVAMEEQTNVDYRVKLKAAGKSLLSAKVAESSASKLNLGTTRTFKGGDVIALYAGQNFCKTTLTFTVEVFNKQSLNILDTWVWVMAVDVTSKEPRAITKYSLDYETNTYTLTLTNDTDATMTLYYGIYLVQDHPEMDMDIESEYDSDFYVSVLNRPSNMVYLRLVDPLDGERRASVKPGQTRTFTYKLEGNWNGTLYEDAALLKQAIPIKWNKKSYAFEISVDGSVSKMICQHYV